MKKLLAILMSAVMLLTCAVGALGEAEAAEVNAKVLTISNLRFSHNDEEVTLNPSATLGFMSQDGKTVVDFAIHNNDQVYLPYQLVVDDTGLLLRSDNGNITLQVTTEQLEALMGVTDEEDAAILTYLTKEFLPAYVKLLKKAMDPAQMPEMQALAQSVMAEIIDPGEGVEGEIIYDGQKLKATTYEYTVGPEDLGRMVDAMFAADEDLKAFADAYFKLFDMIPEEEGSFDIHSFTDVCVMANLSLDCVDNVAENGLIIEDAVMHMAIPEVDIPLEMTIHAVQDGEEVFSSVSGDFNIEDNVMALYTETTQNGGDVHMLATMSISPAAQEEAQVMDEEATAENIPEDAEEVTDDLMDSFGDEDAFESDDYIEGDAPEMASATFELTQTAREDGGADFDMTYTILAQDMAQFTMTGTGAKAADGSASCQVATVIESGSDTFGVDFDVDVAAEPFEIRASAADAQPIGDEPPVPLLTSAAADALNLSNEPSVQELVKLIKGIVEQYTAVREEAVDNGDVDYDADDYLEGDARSAEPYDDGVLAYGDPQFTWLPEGYAVAETDVDTQYDMMNVILSNEATGNNVYVYFYANDNDAEISSYAIGEDGAVSQVEGNLIHVYDYDGSRSFNMDKDGVSLNVYPDSDELSDEDVCQLIAGIQY